MGPLGGTVPLEILGPESGSPTCRRVGFHFSGMPRNILFKASWVEYAFHITYKNNLMSLLFWSVKTSDKEIDMLILLRKVLPNFIEGKYYLLERNVSEEENTTDQGSYHLSLT